MGCLKAVLISEINLKEQEKSTQMNIGVFFASIFVSAGIAWLFKNSLSQTICFVFGISIFMFLFILCRYLQCCTDLHVAKDTLYICLGVDVNRREDIGKNIIETAGEKEA